MFQVETAVFLDVETLIFYFETDAPAVVSNAQQVGRAELLVGNPGVSLGLALRSFLAQQSMDQVGAALRIGVAQIVGPTERLPGLVGQDSSQTILRSQLQKALKVGP